MTAAPEPSLIGATLLVCLSLAGFMAAGAQAEEARLSTDLLGVRNASGNLRVSLYREPETFRKEDRAVKIVSTPAVQGVFEGLTAGR